MQVRMRSEESRSGDGVPVAGEKRKRINGGSDTRRKEIRMDSDSGEDDDSLTLLARLVSDVDKREDVRWSTKRRLKIQLQCR